MSLFKLAVYGGIGYLVYQMFFSDEPFGASRGGRSRQGERGRQISVGGGEGGSAGTRGGQRMSGGGGGGATERTEEPSGTSTTHRVGRGVIS